MAAPVWVLSVDLQTKTATFQSGMAEAARSARTAFGDIGASARSGSDMVSAGTTDVRHSLGLMDNAIRGNHAAAMVDMIRLFQQSSIVMAAIPFAGVIGGVLLLSSSVVALVKHFAELKEKEEQIRDAQTQLGTTINTTFNSLDEKILQAQKQADELAGNHLAAVRDELVLIDEQSLSELSRAFDTIAKQAEETFGKLKASWYEFGVGSAGAQHALNEFKTQYNALLAQPGKEGDAAHLLEGTLKRAKDVLQLQKDAASTSGSDYTDTSYAAQLKLQQEKIGYTQKEIESQEALVNVLQAQVGVEERITTARQIQSGNVVHQEAKRGDTDRAEAARKRAELEARIDREYAQNFRQSEQDIIDATQEGSTERLQAIQTAMEATRELYGTDNETYRKFALEYLKTEEQMYKQMEAVANSFDADDAKRKAEAAKEEADNSQKMGELVIAAEKQQAALRNSSRRVSDDQARDEALKFAEEGYTLKMQALEREIQGLDRSGKEYETKLRQLQDKETQLTRQHENEVTAIKEKAEIERNQRILAARQQFEDSIARGLTQSIMGHETWSRMLINLGDQVLSSAMENRIKEALVLDFAKEKEAAAAARKFFLAGASLPFPANIIAAPVLAAGAFAAVMAFNSGTDGVPGVGRGDIVPALLTPGEGVVPGGVMDGLRKVAQSGGFERGPSTQVNMHVHMNASAMDGDGVDKVFTKHATTIQRHFENTLRKMNR